MKTDGLNRAQLAATPTLADDARVLADLLENVGLAELNGWSTSTLASTQNVLRSTIRRLRYGERRRRLHHMVRFRLGEILRKVDGELDRRREDVHRAIATL